MKWSNFNNTVRHQNLRVNDARPAQGQPYQMASKLHFPRGT